MTGRLSLRRALLAAAFWFCACGPLQAQFRDDFETLKVDPEGRSGWQFFAGDGTVAMDFRQGGRGHASILVDATRDKRGVWWALINRVVSGSMDLSLLRRPRHEVRIEARLRVSHAPRRINLQVLTERTTDYHSHLMEFDIPETERWHTVSMTTRGFEVEPGDSLIGHLALMDWGLQKYRVDIDYIRVDIVDPATAGADQGAAVPYHPPLADPSSFGRVVPVAEDGMIDTSSTDVNLNDWCARDASRRVRLLSVGGTQIVILRFGLDALRGRRVAGHGLLELTTHSLERKAEDVKDFGLLRVVEILGGDPGWRQETVTAASLCRDRPLSEVLNPQPIIDWPAAEGDGGRTYLTLSRPVLQRMIDGRTLGIALRPLGAIHASFYASEHDEGRNVARLLFNLEE